MFIMILISFGCRTGDWPYPHSSLLVLIFRLSLDTSNIQWHSSLSIPILTFVHSIHIFPKLILVFADFYLGFTLSVVWFPIALVPVVLVSSVFVSIALVLINRVRLKLVRIGLIFRSLWTFEVIFWGWILVFPCTVFITWGIFLIVFGLSQLVVWTLLVVSRFISIFCILLIQHYFWSLCLVLLASVYLLMDLSIALLLIIKFIPVAQFLLRDGWVSRS